MPMRESAVLASKPRVARKLVSRSRKSVTGTLDMHLVELDEMIIFRI